MSFALQSHPARKRYNNHHARILLGRGSSYCTGTSRLVLLAMWDNCLRHFVLSFCPLNMNTHCSCAYFHNKSHSCGTTCAMAALPWICHWVYSWLPLLQSHFHNPHCYQLLQCLYVLRLFAITLIITIYWALVTPSERCDRWAFQRQSVKALCTNAAYYLNELWSDRKVMYVYITQQAL